MEVALDLLDITTRASFVDAGGQAAIGILAVQGDFALHAKMLDRIGVPWTLVKHASELDASAGLIMPGGESTTMLKFFESEGLQAAILDFAAQGKPIFGTCAGAILLAKEVLNPAQAHLGLINITVERNAYGRQIDSAVRPVTFSEFAAEDGSADRAVDMMFIRAPIIRRVGEGVRVLGRADGTPVFVEQGNVLAATFHPELTDDERVHRYFAGKVLAAAAGGRSSGER